MSLPVKQQPFFKAGFQQNRLPTEKQKITGQCIFFCVFCSTPPDFSE